MCASKGGKEASDASSCHISERDCDADKMLCGAAMQDHCVMAPSRDCPLVKGRGGESA